MKAGGDDQDLTMARSAKGGATAPSPQCTTMGHEGSHTTTSSITKNMQIYTNTKTIDGSKTSRQHRTKQPELVPLRGANRHPSATPTTKVASGSRPAQCRKKHGPHEGGPTHNIALPYAAGARPRRMNPPAPQLPPHLATLLGRPTPIAAKQAASTRRAGGSSLDARHEASRCQPQVSIGHRHRLPCRPDRGAPQPCRGCTMRLSARKAESSSTLKATPQDTGVG